MNVSAKLNEYTGLFAEMEINKSVSVEVKAIAERMRTNQHRYQEVSDAMGGLMPWYFIACIHNMECSLNFNKHLHNGDLLFQRTVLVPAGRPIAPPKNPTGYTFLESAVDALTMKGYDKKESWTLEEMLYRLEKYNGWGYHYKGVNSPYLWAGSNLYTKGKYVADGVFDENAVSKQLGAALFIKLLA